MGCIPILQDSPSSPFGATIGKTGFPVEPPWMLNPYCIACSPGIHSKNYPLSDMGIGLLKLYVNALKAE